MKYIYFSLIFTFLIFQLSAQNLEFTLADPQPNIFEVYFGSVILEDLDNDGDIDLIQSGIGENLDGQGATISVFLNDGAGNFTITEQNFNNFWTTERAVAGDIDNDGDIDLIVSAGNRTDLYRNDGQAVFTYDANALFEPSDAGTSIIGDVDGDGDNDVIQYGSLSQLNPFAKLFLNDGSGVFTEIVDTPFAPYVLAEIEFIDLEGDGDLDLLSFGENEAEEPAISTYVNDGQGNFTIGIDNGVNPHVAEEISVGDIDNDGDQDFFVSGNSIDSEASSILYLNDGSGQFSVLNNSPFPDAHTTTNGFADFDNDNDLDVLLVGASSVGIVSLVYENLGNNNFIAADSLGGEYIPSQGIADLNGDGKKDIIIQGFVDDTNVYLNTTDISTGLSELDRVEIMIYPNPSNGSFQVQWEEVSDFKLAEVFDIQGNSVFREPVSGQGRIGIEISVPTGVYSIRLSGEKSTIIQSLIVVE